MRTALVGYTGFVGSNLASNNNFDGIYNSKNISDAYQTKPKLLVYAGIRAEKFLANANPEQDLEEIENALENIKKINPEKLVLISTIDVYKTPNGVDEKTTIDISGLQPYGANRYYLESQVRNQYPEAVIIRLPALFGNGLKKNFIYDYIHRIPALLSHTKMQELSAVIPELKTYYYLQENGFYKCYKLDNNSEEKLRALFETSGFTSLKFTDSRSCYQFYNLQYLWRDIIKTLKAGIPLLNIATEPINTGSLYKYLSGMDYINYCTDFYPEYDFRTIYAEKMGGSNGYLYSRGQILREIKEFVEKNL